MSKVFTEEDVAKVIGESWAKAQVSITRKPLWCEFNEPYLRNAMAKVKKARQRLSVAPPKGSVFKAFKSTPLDEVKIVILAQDPYNVANYASGLAFGMSNQTTDVSKSLKNIVKELESDLGFRGFVDLSLKGWANQGILLLNTILTCEIGSYKSGSHVNFGWQGFTDKILDILSEKDKLVWMLWGNYAQRAAKNHINILDHKVIETAHPSPLSAHRGFFGSKPFSKANSYLKEVGLSEINWYAGNKPPVL